MDDADALALWILYGQYADRRVRDGLIPATFDEWLFEEQRLAGEQDELF